MANPTAVLDDAVKFTADALALFKMTLRFAGVKVKPDLVGVMV